MRWIIVIVALATLSAGCFGGGSKTLSEDEAKVVAQDALRNFAEDFAAPDGGRLRMVSGEIGLRTGGSENAAFELEWGTGGTARVELLATGSFGVAIEIYCGPERVVIVYGEDSVARRPQPNKACVNSVQDANDPLGLGAFEDIDLLNVTPLAGGGVEATYHADQGRIDIRIDPQGRVQRMDIATDSGNGFLAVSYGQRKAITVPEANERMSANIDGYGRHDGQAYIWTGLGGEETQPFSEFEVRVINAEDGSRAATFPLGSDGTENGFTYTFTDDGDGVFDGGDSFTVTREGWNSESQYTVVVWDRWAQRPLGETPAIPGLGPLAFVGLLGAALLARR